MYLVSLSCTFLAYLATVFLKTEPDNKFCLFFCSRHTFHYFSYTRNPLTDLKWQKNTKKKKKYSCFTSLIKCYFFVCLFLNEITST